MMLLLGVFLRPILMIIGLLGGMILSYVALRILNGGFFYVAQNILSTQGIGLAWPFVFIIILIIYSSLVVSIVTQCFSLIHLLPDRIMRWIGGPQEQTTMGKEALQSASGATQEAAGKIGGAMGEIAGKQVDAGMKALEGDDDKTGGKPDEKDAAMAAGGVPPV